jgi:hypothetical protein
MAGTGRSIVASPLLSGIPAHPWLQPPPAASPLYDAALRPGPRWSGWLGHLHQYQPQPYPGAPAFSYCGLGLVEFSPIGPSTVNREWLRHFNPTLFAGQWVPTTGLGGLQTGQMIKQPLEVPPQLVTEPLGTPDPITSGYGAH